MEEDIKILKGFLEECKHELMLTKNCWALEMKEVLPRMCFNENTVQALENILNRLEQDEQIIKGQEKTIEKQNKKIEELEKENLDRSEAVFRFSQRHFNDIEKIKRLAELEERIKKGEIVEIGDSIPKSVIRKKIEEYRKERNKLADGHFYDRAENANEDTSLFIAGEVLKELLREEGAEQ